MQHDISRLDIPVDDAFPVSIVERTGKFADQPGDMLWLHTLFSLMQDFQIPGQSRSL